MSRFEVGGVTSAGAFFLVVGSGFVLVSNGLEVTELAVTLAVAGVASEGAGFAAMRLLGGGRNRAERDAVRKRPREECSSIEHASTANRVRRAVRTAEVALDAGEERLPTAHGSLTRTKGEVVTALRTLTVRAEGAESLPPADLADLLATLEDHLPTSVRLFGDLPRTGRLAKGPGSAASALEAQLAGFLAEVTAVNGSLYEVALAETRRRRETEEKERRAGEDALLEHGRFLEERSRRSVLGSAPAEAVATPPPRPLDPSNY